MEDLKDEVLEETLEEVVDEVLEEPKTELELLKEELEAKNDSFLRLTAEYANFRNRSTKERLDAGLNATSKAIEALLPIFDTLQMAISSADPSDESPHKKGLELTLKQLEDSFTKLGVTEIPSDQNTPFDANLHNAIMHIDDENLDSNVIAQTFQKGFKLGEKVIRHSTVQVAN